MLFSLKKQHPRLFLNDQRIRTLKKLKNTDRFFAEILTALIRGADSLFEKPPTQFRIIGPRMLKNCQQILKRISTLALVFQLTNDSKYADRAKTELFAATQFPHWNQNHFLDTAELCTAFGIGYDWLYFYLDENEKELIKDSLIKKGLEAGLEEYKKNAWWITVNNNWNVVCHGGLTIGALAVADDEPEIAATILETALRNIPIVLQTFQPDGAWPAGPEYWAYTTQYCALFLDVLSSALDIGYDHFDLSGLSRTGFFPIYCTGPLDLYCNFADADPDSIATPVLFWLGQKFKQPYYIKENTRLLQKQLESFLAPDAFNIVWYTPEQKNILDLPKSGYFRVTENAFMRSEWHNPEAMFIAAKGGSNQADHAHLDLGSFIFDAFGERWALDLGRDNYDLPGYWDMTEGGGRWRYFRLNNKSHNTLAINDDLQRAGATATVVEHNFFERFSYVIFDLSEAYKPHALSVRRGIAMIDGQTVVVQDEIFWAAEKRNVCWSMITDAEIEIKKQSAILKKRGKTCKFQILAPADGEFFIESARQRPPEMKNDGVRMLKIKYNEKYKKTTLCVVLQPSGDYFALPLQDWKRHVKVV
ncbi:heparinase II/III family protein [candidate division KSB1 bacterium]|nr:heparinase II/III family protein [candidate division KSB1 bacterium]